MSEAHSCMPGSRSHSLPSRSRASRCTSEAKVDSLREHLYYSCTVSSYSAPPSSRFSSPSVTPLSIRSSHSICSRFHFESARSGPSFRCSGPASLYSPPAIRLPAPSTTQFGSFLRSLLPSVRYLCSPSFYRKIQAIIETFPPSFLIAFWPYLQDSSGLPTHH